MSLVLWFPVWHPIDYLKKEGVIYKYCVCIECGGTCRRLIKDYGQLPDTCHIIDLR